MFLSNMKIANKTLEFPFAMVFVSLLYLQYQISCRQFKSETTLLDTLCQRSC